MAIDLLSVTIQNKRRIRLNFSNTLDTGAFGLSPNSMYQIESLDGLGVDPLIDAALAIPGNNTTVELSLSEDLVDGGKYEITVIDVPSTDLSDTGTQTQQFSISQNSNLPNQESNVRNWDLTLYGKDLIWSGTDFIETPTGDLAVLIGEPVVQKAILKRCLSEGLPWDPSYGAHPEEYVDAVPGIMSSLKGSILSELRKDDRIKTAKVHFEQPTESTSQFIITPTLIGSKTPSQPIPLDVGS